MNFNARRTLPAERNEGIALPYVVEHICGRIAATCLTWREALMMRDRLEEKEQALEPACV